MKFRDVVFAITAIVTGAACALGVVILTRADTEVDRQWVAPVAAPVMTTSTPEVRPPPVRTVSSRASPSPKPRKTSPKSFQSLQSTGQSLASSVSPKPRKSVKPSPTVTVTRKPSKSPKPLPSKSPKSSPSPSPAEVHYENCTEVREAGAAPIYRGDPGYGRHLDRDGDGVGCEED